MRNFFLRLTASPYLLNGVDDSFERLGVVHCQVGEDFAVQADVLGAELAHELGVGDTILTRCSVDTLDPEGAEVALLGLAVAIGVGETFLVGVLCNCPDILS